MGEKQNSTAFNHQGCETEFMRGNGYPEIGQNQYDSFFYKLSHFPKKKYGDISFDDGNNDNN
jgi:hypothetical protein